MYGFVSLCLYHLSYLAAFLFYFLLYHVHINYFPSFTFLYMYFVWSLVKNCPTVGQSLFCPPTLESNGKNVVVSSLPFTSLKDLYDFLSVYLVYRSVLQLPYPASVATFPALSLSSLELGQSLTKWSYSLQL